ncbi:hypothetical protein Dimus_018092, partial [Dionaea muscipula]
MRSRRLGELCNLDPKIERTPRSIRAKRRLEFKQQNQEIMDDPPPANHVPAANGAANQRPLREYAATQVDALTILFSKLGNVNAITTPPVSAIPCNFCGGP